MIRWRKDDERLGVGLLSDVLTAFIESYTILAIYCFGHLFHGNMGDIVPLWRLDNFSLRRKDVVSQCLEFDLLVRLLHTRETRSFASVILTIIV